MQDPKASFWPTMVLTMFGFSLIMLEPDMDTAATYAFSAFVIMFISGVPGKYLRNTAILAIAAMIPLAMYGYRGDRLTAYFDPWASRDGTGYQVIQSLYAIGTGGLTGRGLGHSIEKFSYLPEPHTDFIFAVFSEEWGYIGGIVLIVLYGILIWRGIHIATHVQDRFAGLVAVGLTTMIGVAVFLNIGSVTKLLPTIGVPLPFISYGGTSLLFKMFAMGILLNISRYTVNERPEQSSRAFDGKGNFVVTQTSLVQDLGRDVYLIDLLETNSPGRTSAFIDAVRKTPSSRSVPRTRGKTS